MAGSDVDDLLRAAAAEKRDVKRDLRQTLLSGVALTVPFFVTVLVIAWMFNALAGALGPLAGALAFFGLGGSDAIVTKLLAAAIVFGIIFTVGLMAQHGPDTELGARVDALIADLPGVGSIYSSVDRMSDVMVEGDTESFREVKLVEFPREGSYAIAFLTADTPRVLEEAAGDDDLLTVFVPLAPNPVMGGHLLNLPPDRIYDVDMSVEEGMQAVMTTGMAVDESTRDHEGTGDGAVPEVPRRTAEEGAPQAGDGDPARTTDGGPRRATGAEPATDVESATDPDTEGEDRAG